MKKSMLILAIIGNLPIIAVDIPVNTLLYKKNDTDKYFTISNLQPTQEHRKEFGITVGLLMTILGGSNLDKSVDYGYHLTPTNQSPCCSVQFNLVPVLVTAIGLALVYDAMTLEDKDANKPKK
jgi:hypothetical protein